MDILYFMGIRVSGEPEGHVLARLLPLPSPPPTPPASSLLGGVVRLEVRIEFIASQTLSLV